MNSLEFFITGLGKQSNNDETFTVGVSQFDITGHPGTSNKRLSILGISSVYPTWWPFKHNSKILKFLLCDTTLSLKIRKQTITSFFEFL